MRKALNFLLKLALTLTTATFVIGCSSQSPQAQSEPLPGETPQSSISTPLKAAVEELKVMRIKITGGINPKEYGEDLTDLVNIVDKAYGDPKALAAVKSAVEGHKLALKFWQCDRVVGYEEIHQCQDKVLKAIFAKYPDIETQAKEALEGENLSYMSAGLDKEAVMQALWQKTAIDTEAALKAINPPPKQKKS